MALYQTELTASRLGQSFAFKGAGCDRRHIVLASPKELDNGTRFSEHILTAIDLRHEGLVIGASTAQPVTYGGNSTRSGLEIPQAR